MSCVMLGVRAYLKLGDKDDEAAETARYGLAEAKKVTTRIECHRVLGIVAARRGDAAGAEAAFKLIEPAFYDPPEQAAGPYS